MKNYPHVLRAVLGRPWAILPSTLGIVVEVLESRLAGIEWTQSSKRAWLPVPQLVARAPAADAPAWWSSSRSTAPSPSARA